MSARDDIHIQTRRVRLRPLDTSDAPALAQLGGDPDVARMLASVPSPWSVEHCEDWIEASQYRGRLGFRLGVEEKGGQLIGSVGIGGTPVANCAYFLGKDHWGQGLATEATSALLGFVFDRFDTDVVEADHFDDNPASGRVLAKLGFEKVGQGTGTSAARLEPAANTHYRLSRQNFEAHHEIS